MDGCTISIDLYSINKRLPTILSVCLFLGVCVCVVGGDPGSLAAGHKEATYH